MTWILACAATLLAFAAIRRGLDREPWLDELATLEVVDRAGGIARLLRDVHPPLSTLAAAALAAGRRDWRRLRLPGALATALAAGTTALSAEPAGWVAVASAGALAALSPLALRSGSDLRPYGFALLGAALAALGAVRIESTAGWAGLAAGAVLALGSHFAAAALVPGWLVLAGFGGRSLLALAPGLALFGACWVAQREARRSSADRWWIPAPTPGSLLRQLAALGGGGRPGAAAAGGVVALAGVGCLDPLGARLGFAAALGVGTLLVISMVARPVVWPRTLLLLQPFGIAAAGIGVAVLARAAGGAAALLALVPIAVAAAWKVRSPAWLHGDEPWREALAGAAASDPSTVVAACPPWAGLAVAQFVPPEKLFRLPLAPGRDAARELASRLPRARRLLLVVRVDALLLGHEPTLDAFFAELAGAQFERLCLTLVETPDRAILTELHGLATAIRSAADRSWGAPVMSRAGTGFEVAEYDRGSGSR